MLTNLTSFDAENVAQDDDAVLDPPYKFMAVYAANGTITIKNGEDATVLYTIDTAANGTSLPFIIPGRVTKLMSTGTTIADEDMIGYR